MPGDVLGSSLHVFRIRDRITDGSGNVQAVVAGVIGTGAGKRLLRDWELLELINRIPVGRTKLIEPSLRCIDPESALLSMEEAMRYLSAGFSELDLPFQFPEPELLASVFVSVT